MIPVAILMTRRWYSGELHPVQHDQCRVAWDVGVEAQVVRRLHRAVQLEREEARRPQRHVHQVVTGLAADCAAVAGVEAVGACHERHLIRERGG